MPSRRAVLTAVTAVGTTGLAGCGALSGEASSDGGGRSCESSAEARDESSDLIQQASASPGENVVFRTVLNRESEAFERFDSLTLRTTTGDAYLIPREEGTDPDAPARRVYEQALGAFPQNGRIEVVANAEDGETLDALTVEFTCQRRTPVPGE
ncbi:hypothetical protein N0B31_04325 [Salinirubellus salinus]|jgi:hypothetical protein|uniref:Lipoprotein n=1 Tax=Salinirubellus salinus TaxID=1364945 RepID=A0A9E7R4A0_9EURY|nr:hypothetical protein [Salinirubellus salinus]UWM55514.1 hypothetical protein N0B31_04325 [Salinirubellus salinus]